MLEDILKALGWVSIVGGLIVGVYVGNIDNPLLDSYNHSFRWAAAASWFASGIVSGVLFFAAARVIELLEQISHYTMETARHLRPAAEERPSLGSSKMKSLDKVQDYKFKSQD